MADTVKEYRGLDFSKISHRITKTMTTEEALKDIEPLPVPDEVIRGKKQMIIDLKGIHYV